MEPATRSELPVLLVEDSQGLARLMRLVLEAGLERRVALAATGEEALAEIAEQQPALLVLDLDLPDMPGRDVARVALARYGAAVPVLVVSGSTHLGVQLQNLPVRTVLRKPFDCDALVDIARGLLAPVSHDAAAGPTPRGAPPLTHIDASALSRPPSPGA